MPIKRRLNPEQRAKKIITPQHRRTLRHPLMQKICYGGAFEPTAVNMAEAIQLTKSWKGASWTQKVFVQALDILMEKAFDISVLDPETYNRLQEHLKNNDDKMYAANWRIWHIWVWDVYHDHYRLHDMAPGDLTLPTPPKVKRKKVLPVVTSMYDPPKPKRLKRRKRKV